jgi:hypothetical protein
LSLLCPFTKAVWSLILSWEHFDAQLILPSQELAHFISWWEEAETKIIKGERRCFNGMVIFTLWNLWKERNRRIFNNAYESAMLVASRVKEEIEPRKRALTWRGNQQGKSVITFLSYLFFLYEVGVAPSTCT